MNDMTVRQLLDMASQEIETRFKNPFLMDWDIREKRERGEVVPANPFRSAYEAGQWLIDQLSPVICGEDPVCWELALWRYQDHGITLFGDQIEVRFRKKRLVSSDPGSGFGYCALEVLKGEELLDCRLVDLYEGELSKYRAHAEQSRLDYEEKRNRMTAFLEKHNLTATEFYETYQELNDVLYLAVCEESTGGAW